MATPTTRYTALYLRVSTTEQATEGYSLEAQERSGRAYVVALEWPEEVRVYADAGVSGATRDRPALNRMIADARAGQLARVVVSKLDRMGRKATDILAIEEELDRADVPRVYIKDSIDTSTATGRLLRTVLAAVAELERDMILERTMSGMREKARKGEVVRPRGMTGYTYVPKDAHSKAPGTLEVNGADTALIERIFTTIASGTQTATGLAKQLNAEGTRAPRGGMWHHTTISQIIHNPAYTGAATYGKRRTIMSKRGGKRSYAIADPAGIISIPVPALVSPELAQAAQQQLARNVQFAPRNRTRDYLLGGALLKCGMERMDGGGVCGKTMTGSSIHGRPYYKCTYILANGERKHHSVSAATVEDAVWRELAALLLDPGEVLERYRWVEEQQRTEASTATREIDRLEEGRRQVAEQRDRLLDAHLTGPVTKERYITKDAELAGRDAALRAELETVRRTLKGEERPPLPPLDDVRVACLAMAQGLGDMPPAERQSTLRVLVDRVTFTPTGVRLEGMLPRLAAESGGVADSLARCSVGNTTQGLAFDLLIPFVVPGPGRPKKGR